MDITKPRQVVYLEFVTLPTENDGDCHLFFALDHYSKYCFQLGMTYTVSEGVFLEKVRELMSNSDFKKFDHPFELVTYRYPELIEQVSAILKPHKGTVTYDENRLAIEVVPFLEAMFEGMLGQK